MGGWGGRTHLAAGLVVLLAGKGVVNTEVVGVLLLHGLPLVVVQEGVGVGNAEEEPGEALEGLAGRGVLHEEAADEGTVRGNASARSNHDQVGLGGLLGNEHDLAGGAGKGELVAGLGVAEEVGADAL